MDTYYDYSKLLNVSEQTYNLWKPKIIAHEDIVLSRLKSFSQGRLLDADEVKEYFTLSILVNVMESMMSPTILKAHQERLLELESSFRLGG